MKRLLFLAPILIFAALAVTFISGLGRDPSVIPSVLVGKEAPAFSLPAIEGRDKGLASTAFTGEVTLLNVFGSWCVSCRIEHPNLLTIAQDSKVRLVGLDWKDKPGDGARWLDALGDPYAAVGDDAEGRVALDYGVTGAPETFLIDRHGRIRHKVIGPITPEIWRDELLPMIETLRREKN